MEALQSIIKNALICQVCRLRIITKNRFQDDLEELRKSFQCEVCIKKPKPPAGTEVKTFICELCGSGFGSLCTLKDHIKTMHTGEKNFLCHICGHAFLRAQRLRRHEASVHNRPDRYQCPHCRLYFIAKCNFTRHKCKNLNTYQLRRADTPEEASGLDKQGLQENNFICVVCGRGFVRADSLLSHEREEHDERNKA